MFCKSCGSEIDDNAVSCPQCRTSTPIAVVQTNDETPPPVYSTEEVNTQTPAQSYVDDHVSVGTWIGIFFIPFIPAFGTLIYVVMLFIWAFGSTPKRSLRNFAKAQLIMMLIGLIIIIIAVVIIVALGLSISDLENASKALLIN